MTKNILPYASLTAIVVIVIAFIFITDWMSDHFYTLMWLLAFVLCLVWLAYTIMDAVKRLISPEPVEDDASLPSEKFEG
ncbi:hypothetical protein QM480_24660 [Flectobacillus sp. DC10W]|uniref:Uncharacterized protein n=1 Tax=Flectobacillus longus TaxID=2984207 RepID=A0ABT6YVF8_9BACT|nr:hypothetical protein [Flectobacillus longus]MDI9867560.1 hypothetical protein [Flectobacillus longus]